MIAQEIFSNKLILKTSKLKEMRQRGLKKPPKEDAFKS